MRQGFYPVCHLHACLHMLENMWCTEWGLAESRHTVFFQRNGRAKRKPLTDLIAESPLSTRIACGVVVATHYVYFIISLS